MATVIVVDDAAIMRRILAKMLERNGYDVIGEATNGKEATEMAITLQPDLITMDITMNIMNGIEATKIISQSNPNTKICIVSAVGQDSMMKEAIEAGAKSFIIKPFREQNVVKILKTVMG